MLKQTLLALTILSAIFTAAARAEFPLKDNDTWVMAGDSITAQHLHTNYFEAFCYARYPKLTFRFRNSGVGGDTIGRVMARFDWDVAAWKPTIVSVELGMNDQHGASPEQYIAGMKQLSERIKTAGARSVFFSASPINDGSMSPGYGGDARLHDYAVALKKFSADENAPFADQFMELVDFWGHNKLLEQIDHLKPLAADDKLPGVEHLRAFLAAQPPGGLAVPLQGDSVHTGPPGQITMAAALLKELGAEGFVSSATIDAAAGKLTDSKACTVDAIQSGNGQLSFDRLDECVAFPLPDECRPMLAADPTILDLSQYTLTVTGLKAEKYTLQIDKTDVGTYTAKELEAGINLTSAPKGPVAAQGLEILKAVNDKEGIVGEWRALSHATRATTVPTDVPAKLDADTKKLEAADTKIRDAAKPRKMHFVLIESK